MERLIKTLPAPLSTINFVPQTDGNIAEIDFGHIDPSKYNGNLYSTPVNNASGRWQVENIVFILGDVPEGFPVHPG